MDADQEARILRQLDCEEIRDVLRRYCRGVDRRDRELLESVFADGAYARELADQLQSPSAPDAPGQHFLGNLLVEVDEEGGRCEAYFISFLEVEEAGRRYTRTRAGRYLSRLARRDRGWQLVEHVIVDDWDRQDEIVDRVAGVGEVSGTVTSGDPSYDFLRHLSAADGA